MTTDVEFIPRSSWTDRDPHMNNGTTLRPILDGDKSDPDLDPVRYLTRHYRGWWINDSATADPIEYMQEFQRRAWASGKSFEYNYVIFPRLDVDHALVVEYAGEYQAAHSAGENDEAVGVQFALGVDNHPSFRGARPYDPSKPTIWQPITPGMIRAYQWLRDVKLREVGLFGPFTLEREHRHMPNAGTSCPGDPVINADAQLSARYVPPAPEQPAEVAMQVIIHHLECNMYFYADTGQHLAGAEELHLWQSRAATHPELVRIISTSHQPTFQRLQHINGPDVAEFMAERQQNKPWL